MRTARTIFGVGLALAVLASPAFSQDLRFQSATVSGNTSASPSGGSQIQPGGRVTITNTSIRDTLRFIHDIPDFAIIGGVPVVTAVREQWGLDLVARDEPAEVLVIDSVARPESR